METGTHSVGTKGAEIDAQSNRDKQRTQCQQQVAVRTGSDITYDMEEGIESAEQNSTDNQDAVCSE